MNASETSFGSVFNYFYENAEVRIRDRFLMGSPYGICAIYAFYVLVIKVLLPKFMENRKPVDYKKFMTLVDGILCIRSSYFLAVSCYLWFILYNWQCQPLDGSGSWLSNFEVQRAYEFVITMFIYTLQSVVFVMCNKKDSPVATYLLIHHTIFPIMIWIGVNYYPGGHVTFIGFINSIVHFTVTFMRVVSYFFPGWFLDHYRKGIDVNLHIFQFMAVIIHGAQLFFYENCQVPIWIAYYQIGSAFIIAYIYHKYVITPAKRKQVEVTKVKRNQVGAI